MLAGDRDRARLAVLVGGRDVEGRRARGVGQYRAVRGVARVHRPRRPTRDVRHLDLARRGGGRRAQRRVAVGAGAPHAADRPRDRVVVGAAAHERAEVVPCVGEQAGVELAVGRQAQARALAAERARHRRDHADLASAVAVAPALGDLAAVVRIDRLDREDGVDALEDLGGGHDVVHAPAVGRADVHVLDEAHDVAAAAEASREVDDRVLVDAALDDRVDLDRRETRARRDVDASSTVATGVSVSPIARNVASSSASRLTVTRLSPASASACALRPSSAPLVVSVRSTGSAPSIATSRSRFLRKQRLAAGQPDLLDAEAGEDAGDARDLLERQQRRVRQERVVAPEHVARHAVDAAEVAPVGDRDAQVVQAPPERVDERRAGRDRLRRGGRPRASVVGDRNDPGHEVSVPEVGFRW
jgi:hypothetical protein